MIKIESLKAIILKSGALSKEPIRSFMGDNDGTGTLTAQCSFCNCGSNCNRCHK